MYDVIFMSRDYIYEGTVEIDTDIPIRVEKPEPDKIVLVLTTYDYDEEMRVYTDKLEHKIGIQISTGEIKAISREMPRHIFEAYGLEQLEKGGWKVKEERENTVVLINTTKLNILSLFATEFGRGLDPIDTSKLIY